MAWKDKQNAVEELTRKMNENIKNFKKDPLNHRYRKGFYSLFKTLQQNPLSSQYLNILYGFNALERRPKAVFFSSPHN